MQFEICFASNNTKKLEEIRSKTDIKILSLADIGCNEDIPETAPTIEGNSLLKAEYVWKKYGISCFADDTGLEVEALHNAPGVHSARYAGEHRSTEDNVKLLLTNLENTSNRKARFKTVITLISRGEVKTFEGIIYGQITHEKRGKEGFAYDPVFLPDGYDKTFAEMGLEEKNQISHRAIAVEKLVSYLKSIHSL